jgi:predicted branched-subunit amino acid permease
MVMTMTTMDPAPAFTVAAFRRGFLAALPFIASNGIAGIAMGVAYRGLGLEFIPAVLFSLVVYSATAQAVTLGLWALPPPIGAMVAACVAINARYLVMGAHLRQLFPDVSRRVMLPVLFFLADASWLMTVAEAERGRRDAGYLLGSSLPMAIGWIGGTALGYALPLKPLGPLAVAAAFLPLAFIAALLPTQWRGRRSLLPWGVSAAVGIAVASAFGQGWAMLVGGAAGTLVSALGRDDA